MKTLEVVVIILALIFSNPLVAVKLIIESFDGFGAAADPSQAKSATWRVKAIPNSSEIQPETYSDIELEAFTTSEQLLVRLTNYNQIPAAKAYDQIQRESFQFTPEIQEIELGEFSAPFLNVCIIAAHKHWNKDEDNWEKKRIIISHTIVPLAPLRPIDFIRIKLLGMSLFSWTLPQQESSTVKSYHKANAEGQLIIADVMDSERHTFGSWPLSDWIRVEFQDVRCDTSDPSLHLPDFNATITFSNFRAFLFQGDFQGQILNFQALDNVLKRGNNHCIIELNTAEDFNIPIVNRDKTLNICIVVKQELAMPGKKPQTADFLLNHLTPTTSFLELEALVLHLIHSQVGNNEGGIAPQAQVSLLEQGHDGMITPVNQSTAWWNQRSF